jgi:hypothetical protein
MKQVASFILRANFLLALFIDPEELGVMFLRNIR